MKKMLFLALLLLTATMFLEANPFGYDTQHFVPAYHTTPPPDGQRPYLAHNILVYMARVNGVDLGAGCELGCFDGDTCVGGSQIHSPILGFDTYRSIRVSSEGGDVPGSAASGNFMYFRLWDIETDTEYAYPEMFAQFQRLPSWPDYPYQFFPQATTFVWLEYVTPVAKESHYLAPPIPPGGYVNDIDFPETGVTLQSGFVQGGGAGTMTVYAYDVNSLDTYYGGTPGAGTMPVESFSDFHWFIDATDIKFYADDQDYPVEITFTIPTLPPGVSIDPDEAAIYRRDIHGTSWFYQLNSHYDPDAGTITVYITNPDDVTGEYILAGFFEEGLPVELSSFTAVMNNLNNAVNLTWVTQSEINLVGYRVYRGLNGELSQALNQSILIPATNTSQQVSYIYKDEDIMAEQVYFYWLEAAELDGSSDYYGPVIISTPGEAGYTPEIPLHTGISSLYPNPFNPNLTVGYQLESKQDVCIMVMNQRGQLVKTLVNSNREKGAYKYVWDGTDEAGRYCASGVYTVWMKADGKDYFRKAVLLK